MRPTYSRHARLRMRQRIITEPEVEQVLLHYHTAYTDRHGNPVYTGDVAGRRLRVVVAQGSIPPHVITLYVA